MFLESYNRSEPFSTFGPRALEESKKKQRMFESDEKHHNNSMDVLGVVKIQDLLEYNYGHYPLNRGYTPEYGLGRL
jgi:hypothetical protein